MKSSTILATLCLGFGWIVIGCRARSEPPETSFRRWDSGGVEIVDNPAPDEAKRGPSVSATPIILLKGSDSTREVQFDVQEKALTFYTDTLGFRKKADFSQGSYRWLTIASSDEPDGVELILESNANPAAKAYQAALRGDGQPAAQFLSNDVQADHDRLAAKGVQFSTPVTSTTGSVVAVLDDTCGNLIQLVQLTWG